MIVYNIYFVLVILLAVIISCARKKFWFSTDNRIIIDNKLNVDMLCKIGFCIIAFGYLIFLASQRYDVGFDYFQYTMAYEQIGRYTSLKEAFSKVDNYERGYVVFEYILSRISPHYTAFLFMHALIVTSLFAITLLRLSKSIYISAILYFLLNIYAISLNFSRQIIAMAILFAGFGLLSKKRYLWYSLLVLLAMSFHFSAAIMFVFIVFCFIKSNKYFYVAAVALSVITLLLSNQIIDLACKVFDGLQKYAGSFYIIREGSAKSFATFFLMSLIVILLYFFTSWKEYSKDSQIYVKISIACLILSLYMRKHFILDRLAVYFIMFYILIIPDVLSFVLARIGCLVSRIKKRLKEKSFKNFFRYKSLYQLLNYMIIFVFLIFNCISYYNYSVRDGSHRVYPYNTVNEKLLRVINNSKSDIELLTSERCLPNYLGLLNNEDYIVVVTYDNDWHTLWQYNRMFMEAAEEEMKALGIYEIIDSKRVDGNKYGGFILDGGKLVERFKDGGGSYFSDSGGFGAYATSKERWMNINGLFITENSRSLDFVVYSKSEKRVVDYCKAAQNELTHSHNLYHYNVMNNREDGFSNGVGYKELIMSMFDVSNTIILYNNNEDYEGQELSTGYNKYYIILGSTIAIDALCNQNVAAMRFGGEWREIIYPASPARIEANIDDVMYDVYADSYNSYCKINGVEVSSAGTGLNVLIISPEGEMLFNGSVDVYSNFNEVTVNDEFAYIPA